MKKLLMFIVLPLLLVVGIYFIALNRNAEIREVFCFDSITEKLESGMNPDSIFQKEFEELQLLVEYSLVARSEMLTISRQLKKDPDGPIASKDLLVLKSGTEEYLKIREDLFAIAEAYECTIDVEEATLIESGIDPILRTKAVLLSLSAALTLYDNYMLGAIIFEEDARLRRIVNDPDMGFGLVSNKLQEMTLSATSVENRHRIRRAISFYDEQKESLETSDDDSDLAYLTQLIDTSPSLNFIRKIQIGTIASKKAVAFEKVTIDLIDEVKDEGFDMISGLFGNTIGMYESRKGLLHGNDKAREHLQSLLQPMDILLEKTPFRLTDKLIPGHFGHVAIWVGTENELKDYDIWDEPLVEQYHSDISDEKNPDSKDQQQVLEALRDGVQLNSLEDFLNVDDVVILRPVFDKEKSLELTREALMMAFRQVGKKYDFNFDVNTTDKIVCSELAYVSFPSVDWPTEKTLGRHTISPDNVARMAENNVPLEVVAFYHNGEWVDTEDQLALMTELMNK